MGVFDLVIIYDRLIYIEIDMGSKYCYFLI